MNRKIINSLFHQCKYANKYNNYMKIRNYVKVNLSEKNPFNTPKSRWEIIKERRIRVWATFITLLCIPTSIYWYTIKQLHKDPFDSPEIQQLEKELAEEFAARQKDITIANNSSVNENNNNESK